MIQRPHTPTDRCAPTSPSMGRDKLTYRSSSKSKSRYMRKNMTDAEGLLWYYLRDFKENGFYFRRQVPIGSYIVDFACLKRKLIVELDGLHHSNPAQVSHDETRDEWLHSQGFSVLRFDNIDIFKHSEVVLQNIQQALDSSLPLKGGGGRVALGGGSHSK